MTRTYVRMLATNFNAMLLSFGLAASLQKILLPSCGTIRPVAEWKNDAPFHYLFLSFLAIFFGAARARCSPPYLLARFGCKIDLCNVPEFDSYYGLFITLWESNSGKVL